MSTLVQQALDERTTALATQALLPPKPALLYCVDNKGVRILGEASNFSFSTEVRAPEMDTPRMVIQLYKPIYEGATRAERRRNERLARKARS